MTEAPAKKAPNQKKLRSTPLARRRLKGQFLDLAGEPEIWPSDHLRRAYQIVSERETARQIVLESVRAADRATKTALERDLGLARRSALADFTENCKRIVNCTKRLRKEIGTDLDEAARSAFAGDPVDLEGIQDFFNSARKIVELRLEDKVAYAIYRHLVASKRDITLGKDLPLESRTPMITVEAISPEVRLTGRRTPKIAVDYEALPRKARLACQNALRMLVDKKLQLLTAHDLFASLHAITRDLSLEELPKDEPPIIDSYLAEIERIWTKSSLDVGRGNHALIKDYLSPFHEFAERILLEQRDPGSKIFRPSDADPLGRDPRSRTFSPFSQAELRSAWEQYNAIPLSGRHNISSAPFGGTWLITEHVLRSYLERSSKKST